jgi:hypothetical protein
MADKEAVTSDNTAKPSRTTSTEKALDAWVEGTKSPKPTVAAVVKASHKPSDKVGIWGSITQKPTPPRPNMATAKSSE